MATWHPVSHHLTTWQAAPLASPAVPSRWRRVAERVGAWLWWALGFGGGTW